MISRPNILSRKLAVPATVIILSLFVSFAFGSVVGMLPRNVSILVVPGFALLAFIVSNHRYEAILWSCLAIFLVAQFQLPGVDSLRWVILFLAGLLSAYMVRNSERAANRVAIGIGVVALYAAMTSFVSYYPYISLFKSISLLLLALLLMFLAPVLELLHPRTGAKGYMLRMFLYSSLFVVLSNSLFFLAFPSQALFGDRFRGWFVNPNGIGAIYGAFFVPILGFQVLKRGLSLRNMIWIVVFLLALAHLFASQSRAGITAGMASLFVLVLGRKRWFSRILAVIMAMMIILIVYLSSPQDNLVRRFIYRNEVELQGSGRLFAWIDTWNKFKARPVFGSGLGVTSTGLDLDAIAANSSNYTIEKGNSFLGALEELGIVGFTLLVIVLLLPILGTCWRRLNVVDPKITCDLVLVAIVVAGLLDSALEAWLLSVGSFPCLAFWIFASLLSIEKKDIASAGQSARNAAGSPVRR